MSEMLIIKHFSEFEQYELRNQAGAPRSKVLSHYNEELMESSTMRVTDEVDKVVITRLKENARVPYTKIAEEIGLSEAAVRKRVERLVEEGVIKKFTVEVDAGDKLKAMILISVQPPRPNPVVAQEMKNVEGVELVLEVAGEVDIVAVVSGSSMQEVNKYIDEVRRIEGVSKTNSMIVLRSWV